MEAKLREYRALRRRQQLIDNAKKQFDDTTEKVLNFITPKFLQNMGKEEEVLLIEDNEPLQTETPENIEGPSDITSEVSECETIVEENPESWNYFIVKWTLYTVTWLTMYLVFLKLEFGAVFFVISALIGIYVNTRTRPKKKGEVSAYSVFNQNCVSIDGTLKAEQFEREIRYGAGSVR